MLAAANLRARASASASVHLMYGMLFDPWDLYVAASAWWTQCIGADSAFRIFAERRSSNTASSQPNIGSLPAEIIYQIQAELIRLAKTDAVASREGKNHLGPLYNEVLSSNRQLFSKFLANYSLNVFTTALNEISGGALKPWPVIMLGPKDSGLGSRYLGLVRGRADTDFGQIEISEFDPSFIKPQPLEVDQNFYRLCEDWSLEPHKRNDETLAVDNKPLADPRARPRYLLFHELLVDSNKYI